MRSNIEAETLGMDAEDVEDLRQEARHVRSAAGGGREAPCISCARPRQVTAKRLAGGADGCRELLVLTPSGEELREMVMSCDDASLEQLQDRALELLNTLHHETTSASVRSSTASGACTASAEARVFNSGLPLPHSCSLPHRNTTHSTVRETPPSATGVGRRNARVVWRGVLARGRPRGNALSLWAAHTHVWAGRTGPRRQPRARRTCG